VTHDFCLISDPPLVRVLRHIERGVNVNDKDDDISRNKNSVTVTVSRPYIIESSRETCDWHECINVFDFVGPVTVKLRAFRA